MKSKPQIIPAKRVVCDQSGVKQVTLISQDGQICTVDIAKELFIPEDPALAWQAAKRAAFRMTFWVYHTQRALRRVRRLEMELKQTLGDAHITQRHNLQKEVLATGDGLYDPKQYGVVQALVPHHPKVQRAEEKLRDAQYRYGILYGIQNACQDRIHTLRARLKSNTNYE